jgi:hypothetical protein
MADQTSVGLDGLVHGFEKKVADLTSKVTALMTDSTKKVSRDMFNCSESKLDRIVMDNNLKKPSEARA